MSGFLAVAERELKAYFYSPLAYVVLTFFLLVQGYYFSVIVAYLADPRFPAGKPLELFFGQTIFTWLVLIFAGTFLTMRLVSEELRSGTIETLMTAPVSETHVVLGKYAAALVFYLFLWAPTLVFCAIVRWFTPVDWGPIAASYLGIVGIGALFLAVGLFASATSKNQIVAAVASFFFVLVLFSIGLLETLANGETARAVLGYLNLWQHMDEFAKGIVDTRHLVYYATGVGFFLFLTTRALAARKWR
ncbi:MAG: transporter permease [Acidobacteria bacterium]|jgi:ABC-2 type transport system permease protein|nr:transporter permease [Acidobacteriota bacterium]